MEITKEEIEREAWNSEYRQIGDCGAVHGFIEGAEWAIDKINQSEPKEPSHDDVEDAIESEGYNSDDGAYGFRDGIAWYKKQIGRL